MAVMMVLLVGNRVICTKAYVIQCSYKFYENVLILSIVKNKRMAGYVDIMFI